MQAAGWDVAGTEIDRPTVDRLQGLGIDARTWDDATDSVDGGYEKPFDVITCWHVMEHVDHPRQTTDWVQSQLKPDGFFQVTVPNARSLQARLFGRHWVHLDVPRHRQHFSPGTLKSLVESHGFAVVSRTNVAWEYDWFGVIQSTINLVYPKKNVLFDKLTYAPDSPATRLDTVFSFAAGYVIAAATAAPLLAAAMLGDGATLTLTCRVADGRRGRGRSGRLLNICRGDANSERGKAGTTLLRRSQGGHRTAAYAGLTKFAFQLCRLRTRQSRLTTGIAAVDRGDRRRSPPGEFVGARAGSSIQSTTYQSSAPLLTFTVI